MSGFTVSFQVFLPARATEAFIIISNESVSMTLVRFDSATRKNLFEASVRLRAIACFPASISYCYIYGDDVSPNLTLVVARPPLSAAISVRDVLDQTPTHATAFSVSFCIHRSGRPDEQLLWVPIATRLATSERQVPMSAVGDDHPRLQCPAALRLQVRRRESEDESDRAPGVGPGAFAFCGRADRRPGGFRL
jgi:hypothetical protein